MPPSIPVRPRLTTAQSSFVSSPVLALRPAQSRARTMTIPTAPQVRSFLMTPATSYRQPPVPASDLPIPSARAANPAIPPYPPGERPMYKQSNMGLYGSARIRFGNNVSRKYEVKTRRAWRPNVHGKRLWSESLGVFVRTRVTTRVLRTIDKVGGLDSYLLGGKSARIRELGPWGWKLRWRIMQTEAVRERFAREREALGLPPRENDVEGLGDAPAEVLAEGTTRERLMEETERMLQEEAEFEIGEAEEFMREEKSRK